MEEDEYSQFTLKVLPKRGFAVNSSLQNLIKNNALPYFHDEILNDQMTHKKVMQIHMHHLKKQ